MMRPESMIECEERAKDLDRVEKAVRSRSKAFCLLCNKYVRLVTPQETEQAFKANWVEIVRLTESGRIHRIHNSAGKIRICLNSLHDADRPRPTGQLVSLKPIPEND